MWVHLHMCKYVEKYHICGLKVGVGIICGYHYTWVFTVIVPLNKTQMFQFAERFSGGRVCGNENVRGRVAVLEIASDSSAFQSLGVFCADVRCGTSLSSTRRSETGPCPADQYRHLFAFP